MELDWLEAQSNKRYKAKTQRHRNQKGVDDIKILNRSVRVTDKGYDIEADPRHAELVTDQIARWDGGKETIREVTTPCMGVDADMEDMKHELSSQQLHAFRSMAARCLYLSLDRHDIQFSANEVCRQMSKPTTSSWKNLQRIAKYIRINSRAVWN